MISTTSMGSWAPFYLDYSINYFSMSLITDYSVSSALIMTSFSNTSVTSVKVEPKALATS